MRKLPFRTVSHILALSFFDNVARQLMWHKKLTPQTQGKVAEYKKKTWRCQDMAGKQRRYDKENKIQAVKLSKEVGSTKAAGNVVVLLKRRDTRHIIKEKAGENENGDNNG